MALLDGRPPQQGPGLLASMMGQGMPQQAPQQPPMQVAGGSGLHGFMTGMPVIVTDRGMSRPGGWSGTIVGPGSLPDTLKVLPIGSNSDGRDVAISNIRPGGG